MNRGLPRADPRNLAEHGPKDYVARFVFGAAISLLAGLIGMFLGPKFGGVWLGFPAILPASLTMIQKRHGKEEAAIDSEGAVLGAAAFVVYAIVLTIFTSPWGVVATLVVALVLWTVVAVALYTLTRIVFGHHAAPK
jgi:Protein of unknown function (DUF3147)